VTSHVPRLRLDVHEIVTAATSAVQPEGLIARRLSVIDNEFFLDGRSLARPLRLGEQSRIAVIGAGKAAAGMAAGLAEVLKAADILPDRITGLVSVPEGCRRNIPGIEIRETRPAAENVPTAAAVSATRDMLRLVGSLGTDDLAVAVISGGGSALLAAPRAGVTLCEKVRLAKFLAAAGAPITEINVVRQAASDVKAGGLARVCSAGRLLVLVLSDVIGDSLEAIASGPCMPVTVDAAAALAVLERYGAFAAGIAPDLVAVLRAEAGQRPRGEKATPQRSASWTTPRGCKVDHVLLGNNATAVDAAAEAARCAGYDVAVRHAIPDSHETADDVGRRLAREVVALALAVAVDNRPRAIIEGGEAVVRLPLDHGVGGRNQQTVAAALAEIIGDGQPWPEGMALVSVGTDGEDGPTRAAGGMIDADGAEKITALGLDAQRAVGRCDALPLLEGIGGLIVTGPTGTNVADVRVILALSVTP